MRCLFAFVLLASTTLLAQCDCIAIPAKKAKLASEIVFRGTVEGFRGSGAERTVIFRVSRVWKGRVGSTVEMPGIEGLCDFSPGLLNVGNDLIVYANDARLPLHCQTALATQSPDIRHLGRGHKPKP